MKTLTKLVNTSTNVEIVIADTLTSNADKFRHVAANGCDLGRTSFMNILTGKATSAKGWELKIEAVKPVETKKVFGLEFKKSDVSTSARTGTPRKRRDMEQVVANARKSSKLGAMIVELETKGFSICDVEKAHRWICVNLPTANKTCRSEPRVDISPLKNGKVNVVLYVNNRTTGIRHTLEAKDATPANIAKVARHPDFMNYQA